MAKKDWHPADIIAALRKRGTSLARVSRESGLASSTLANALTRPWPKGEWLIATALNIHPSEIWPSRYLSNTFGRIPKKPFLASDAQPALSPHHRLCRIHTPPDPPQAAQDKPSCMESITTSTSTEGK